MTVEGLQKICQQLEDVVEDIKWGDHLCFNTKGKMFLVTAPDQSPISASFKVSDENFAELPEREGFKPAPYMAKYKWVYVDNIKRLSAKEWKQLLQEAHALVRTKPKSKTKKK